MNKIENEVKIENAAEKDEAAQVDVKSVAPRAVKLERIKTGFKAGKLARCN